MWQKIALAAAAVLPLVGCASGGAGTAQPPVVWPVPAVAMQSGQSSIFGTAASDYTLLSIDGHRLPFAPAATSDAALPPAEVISGTLTLQPNGTFSMSTWYREAVSSGQRLFDNKSSGSCAPDGVGFRMFWDGGGDTQLSISGDSITVNNSGMLFRYLKRR